jgi:hypothetical protein
LTTAGCARLRRIDRTTGEVLDRDNIVTPRVAGVDKKGGHLMVTPRSYFGI